MADGLFDNRYRYDFIYPRGRSGETLRAVDTAENNRPVVIKRPAPNDAPPIRAGQEVSILNERKALVRLAGHNVLTAFLGEGQFSVGGMPHQYIVMERAQGQVVADIVLELAARGERLPLLEMLVIVEKLLDLLHAAHGKDIVYNDVDAKHLFWNRDEYTLKLIDWGNAVFLEGDEVTPQGISRQSDIFQVGELLYFILTGGSRMETVRDAGEDYAINFGADSERVAPRLQAIVSKAAHPNPKLRYRTIHELRRDLNDYRQPLERERDSVVNRVIERLRRSLSKNDLRALLETLDQAIASDPGYPLARTTREDIQNRLRDLDVSADLDAVRIYMEGGNWSRAADLLNELRDKAGPGTAAQVGLLLDCAVLLLDARLETPSNAILDAIGLILDNDAPQAAEILLIEDTQDDNTRRLQWLMAERISSRVPEVLLLRPNLFRVNLALAGIGAEGISLGESRAMLAEITDLLDEVGAEQNPSIAHLRDTYRAMVDRLSALSQLLAPIATRYNLSSRKLPLSALERALNAAMALADNMHVIGKQAASSPRDALAALDSCRVIDPINNPLWDVVGRMLNALYELLQSYQVYLPAADGSDVDAWLSKARSDVSPFAERLFDEMLVGMVAGLKEANAAWKDYAGSVVQGNRQAAVNALSEAAEAVSTVSPSFASWLNQLRTVVDGANYVERHAIYGGLGRVLADGWEAFDRGRLPDAERLGQQAVDIARSDAERFAAKRLFTLAGTTRDWIDRSGAVSEGRTQAVLKTVEGLYTPEELSTRDHFAAQMPSRETYLRAMGKGLVELYQRGSTPALRLLFVTDVLLGVLEAHDANLDDALFWRDVAIRALPEHGAKHPAIRVLDEFVERRRELNRLSTLLNQLNGQHALPLLESTRRQLEESSQARLVAAAAHTLRDLEAMLRDWSDGEFRAAGSKLDSILALLNEAEQTADITLTQYRAWLVELQATAAELHTLNRQMRQVIERRPAEPSDLVRDAHRRMTQTTSQMLGESYAAQLRQWHETYEAFLAVYTDPSTRRSGKLSRFNELFRAMFIDRHPAYPLYRHWYDLTESAPEFPAPPTSDPTPRLTEAEAVEPLAENYPYDEFAGSRYADSPEAESGRRRLPLPALAAAILALLAVIALVIFIVTSAGDDDSGTPPGSAVAEAASTNEADGSSTPTAGATDPGSALLPSGSSVPFAADTTEIVTLDPRDLITPTLITRTVPPTSTERPTNTPAPPTITPTPSATETASATPTITNTPTPTLTLTPTVPPDGLRGVQDLLDLPPRIENLPWSSEDFALDESGTFWRFGVGSEDPEEQLFVSIPPQTLDFFYGADAPGRVRSVEATLSLITYIPTLLQTDDVYFGLMLQSAEDPARVAGLTVQVEGATAVNLWQRTDLNAPDTFVIQRSVSAVVARIRLDRDPVSGDVLVFFNDIQIGGTIPMGSPETPVQPVLFVQDGGVIVSVTNWRVTLR
ncbi:MAG: hypothetical protein SF029_02645 [bacterium]|nr:hypothetical protein [bacterium]